MQSKAEELLEELQNLADIFYQNQNNKGIKKLPEMTRKLSEYMTGLSPEQQQDFMTVLKGIMEAMETKNYVMLADILVFEAGERIEEYQM